MQSANGRMVEKKKKLEREGVRLKGTLKSICQSLPQLTDTWKLIVCRKNNFLSYCKDEVIACIKDCFWNRKFLLVIVFPFQEAKHQLFRVQNKRLIECSDLRQIKQKFTWN